MYRLLVVGRIGPAAQAAFEDVEIETSGADTALVGDFDQSGLFGALQRIHRLRLELVEVTRIRQVAPIR